MPSRAEMRIQLEHVLRGIVIAVLVVMLWQSMGERSDSGSQAVSARGIGVGSPLTKWSVLPRAPGTIHAQLDAVPSPVERAWLGALAGAGSSVTWTGDVPPAMIDAQPIASPTGGARVLVAAPSGSSVVISDEVGVIDTVKAQNAGAAFALRSDAAGSLTARVGSSAASAVQRDSVVLRKVLVIGDAGWESKFVVAALEEEGWKVDAFIRVAPTVDVTQGSAAVIDTSRYSAVVALDRAATPYATRIIEFARTGGGVVLAPAAAALDAMTPVGAGTAGRATSDARASAQASGSVSLNTLALAPITVLRSDAVPLERRAGAVATAARRIGAGRSLQLGYEDTWRWRMGGGEGAVRDHRLWWTGLVSSVAYAPRVPRITTATTDEAPMIGLVAAVGPSVPAGGTPNLSGAPSDWMVWLFALLSLGLIGEVASRRLRGAQ